MVAGHRAVRCEWTRALTEQTVKTLGLDIGGANLKAAHSNGGVWTESFALWSEPDALTDRIEELLRRFSRFDRIGLAMTAELCDCFATKRHGVNHVLGAVETVARDRPVRVWSTDGQWMTTGEAREHILLSAASNWHALASCVAQEHPTEALLVDVGSTTTDVIRLSNGHVAARGLTDLQRLASSELVYLGVTRTPLSCLGPTIELKGEEVGLMAERFATTRDVFLLTGALPEQPSCTDTADGRPATIACAAARVVRMIGADLEMLTVGDATHLAQAFAKHVEQRVTDAIEQVVARARIERVILSGSGAFAAQGPASTILPDASIVRLVDVIGPGAASAACAYALVQLLDRYTE